jgi:large subunit ribosomal protein L22
MGKPKREKNYECVSEAKWRYAPMPARKARVVCDLIRGKAVKEAMQILQLLHKPSAAPAVMKVLKSARANALFNKKVEDPDSLVVSQVLVDGAFMLKRLRAAPMGRAVRVRKRFCHITIRLNNE